MRTPIRKPPSFEQEMLEELEVERELGRKGPGWKHIGGCGNSMC